MMKTSAVSIIIPAYNEASVIVHCLQALMRQDFEGIVQIIVVCNGCVDDTYSIVSTFNQEIDCLETSVGSKTNALNMGDNIAQFYPRIYLDADIILSQNAVSQMSLTLENKNYLATSAVATMNLTSSSWAVKAFYDIWLNLPYCKAGMIGSGVYALSEQGRKKFNEFPNIIADDGYVRCLFTEAERPVTASSIAHVSAPKDLISLIKITTRSRLGGYELQEKYPDLLANEAKDYRSASVGFLLNVKQWPKIAVYILINVITRIRAKQQFSKNITEWERDESSRNE